jgi:MFS family permease
MRLTQPLRRRDFRMLFVGVTVSLIGDGIYTVALAFQVYELSNEPGSLSVVLLCWSAGMVIASLGAGVVLDRVDRRMAMVAADALQLAAVGALGALSLADALEVWHCAALASLVGAGTAFVKPAVTTLVPMIVPPEEVVAASSLHTSLNRAAFLLIGPALGGLVVGAVGTGAAFVIDAGTFAASIAAVLLVRTSGRVARELSASPLADLREGLRFVRSQQWIWGTVLGASVGILCFVGPVEVALPYVVKNVYGDGAGAYGLLLALGGATGLLAALAVGTRGMPRRPLTVMFAVWIVSILMVAGYGLVESTAAAVGFALVYGLGTAGDVIWFSSLQTRVPSEMLGRVSSLDWLVSFGLLPVSFALAGPAAEAFGARATLVGAGVLGASALGFIFLAVPDLRRRA